MNKPETPPFLLRLSLNADADARAVRRAYARELKLIDQESDAAGFQRLREQYEAALQWLAYQEWEREPGGDDASDDDSDGAIAAPPAPVSLLKPEPAALAPDAAATAFQDLADACQRLMAEPDGAPLPAWEQAIRARLAHDDLFNIAVRTRFEHAIVDWLAEGWQPGKEKLFAAASDVFNWAEDSRRLQQFGYAGMVVNLAVVERAVFLRQPESDIEIYRTIIGRLRQPGTPGDNRLRYDMPFLEQMLARFPHLMSLSVSDAAVSNWRAGYEKIGGIITPAQHQAAQPESEGIGMPWGMGILVIITVLRMCGSPATPAAPSAAPVDVGALIPVVSPLSQLERNLTDADVPFVFPKDTPPGRYTVKLDVYFNANGDPLFVDRQKSPYPAFDKAVQDAIRRACPYPEFANMTVTFAYTATVAVK